MVGTGIQAVYVYDRSFQCIVNHIYRGRPSTPESALDSYRKHAEPRPSVVYDETSVPPEILFATSHHDLLILIPTTADVDPLYVLEFQSRLVDIFEEFLGSPLLSNRIEGKFEIVAQLLSDICDSGLVSNTEPDLLKDTVVVENWVSKVLNDVVGSRSSVRTPNLSIQPSGPSIPWRRPNVKHTSNELYVDIVESFSVLLAPSGRPLRALVNGSILFTSQISGVPELSLNLTVPSGKQNIAGVLQNLSFHPCVRLNQWARNPGELSFIPPDGKFIIAGYEIDFCPRMEGTSTFQIDRKPDLPILSQITKPVGASGNEFEVRITFPTLPGYRQSSKRGGNAQTNGKLRLGAGPSQPPTQSLREVSIEIPVPEHVLNLTNITSSKGSTTFQRDSNILLWRFETAEVLPGTSATLRCTVRLQDDDFEPLSTDEPALSSDRYQYDEGDGSYQETKDGERPSQQPAPAEPSAEASDLKEKYRTAMPSTILASFKVKNWVASGLKVASLDIDVRKSRGLGEGVRPHKGVKYLTTSARGIEYRV